MCARLWESLQQNGPRHNQLGSSSSLRKQRSVLPHAFRLLATAEICDTSIQLNQPEFILVPQRYERRNSLCYILHRNLFTDASLPHSTQAEFPTVQSVSARSITRVTQRCGHKTPLSERQIHYQVHVKFCALLARRRTACCDRTAAPLIARNGRFVQARTLFRRRHNHKRPACRY